MGINRIRWRELFKEAEGLAKIADQLTKEFAHQTSKNIWGRPEWEYDERVWFRKVLPLIGGVPGVAFQTRLVHFTVEAKSFLKDMGALRKNSPQCHNGLREDQILYDEDYIPESFSLSWQIFLVRYGILAKALSHADLECESSDCGPIDEISLPQIPGLKPYLSMEACLDDPTRSFFGDDPFSSK